MSTYPSDLRVAAAYFDGRTTASRAVTLSIEEGVLLLSGSAGVTRWPLAEVHITEKLGNTPRLLTHSGGGHCEVNDQAGLDRLLASAGKRHDWLDTLHHSLPWAFAAIVLIVVVAWAGYRYLLPWGSEAVAMRIPAPMLQKMGSSTLEALDKYMLKPSTLDEARQQTLRDAYAALRTPADAELQYKIVFRSSPMGPNAFALPDGTIVMLDELVKLTDDDNEIIAVLAHERGHVERRHAMRMLLQSSVVGLVMAWYVGDVSALLATAPTILMQAKYSRDMEREADQYAEQTLHANDLSPCLLGTILDKMEAAYREKAAEKGGRRDSAREDDAMDYLSSHPATSERMKLMCPG